MGPVDRRFGAANVGRCAIRKRIDDLPQHPGRKINTHACATIDPAPATSLSQPRPIPPAVDHRLWQTWFTRAYTADILPYGAPQFLHHYVPSYDALMSILASQSMWASDIDCLDDSTEYRHGMQTCFEALEAVGHPLLRPHVELVRQGLGERFKQRTFVTCFSTANDLEAQWERYADSQRGFVVTFDPAVISALKAPQWYRLMPVEYGNAAQLDRARRAVRRASEDLAAVIRGTNRFEVLWAIQARFTLLAVEMFCFCASFKGQDYKEEREWRLIYTREDSEPIGLPIHNRSAHGRSVKYVKVDLTDRYTNGDLPSFAAVRAGPKTDFRTAHLVQQFLWESACPAKWEQQPPF